MSDIHALSGAYAVDALDDIERASFERHLAGCAAAAPRSPASGRRPPHWPTTRRPHRRPSCAPACSPTSPGPPAAAARPPQTATEPRTEPVVPAPVVPARRAPPRSVAGGRGRAWRSRRHPWRDDSSQHAQRDRAGARGTPTPSRSRRSSRRRDGHGRPLRASVHQAVLVTEDVPPPPDGKVYQMWLQDRSQTMVSGRPDAGRPDHRPARGRRRRRIGRRHHRRARGRVGASRPRRRSRSSTSAAS